MCKKNCDKNNENDFHKLTKYIYNLEIKKAKLFLESQKKSKFCSLCLCSNGKYKYKTDDNKTKYLCKYCIKSVKKTKKPIKTYSDRQCPVCGQLDGNNIIDSITLSLCNDCYHGITSLSI